LGYAAPILFQNGAVPDTNDAYYFGPEGGVTNSFTTSVAGVVSSITFAAWNQQGEDPPLYLGGWSIVSSDFTVDESDTFFTDNINYFGSGTVVDSADTFNGPPDGTYDIRLVTFDLLTPLFLPMGSYDLTLQGVFNFGGPSYWGVANGGSASAVSLQSGPMPLSNYFVLFGPDAAGDAPELNPASSATALSFCFFALALLPRRARI